MQETNHPDILYTFLKQAFPREYLGRKNYVTSVYSRFTTKKSSCAGQWEQLPQNILAHQTIWNIQCSKYTDEEGKNENPVLFRKLQEIQDEIIRRLESGSARASRVREFALIKEITDISGTVKPYEKGEKRK
ncbi:hypothetical protein RvY_06681 [Ramazzottius varieornatus]|uniref:Uncharacterized protein n=1 Tax=Ramazzottius varieornatus TaxID=947166 RepID=A0A1D1UZE3_RAMVA|nr:hypothetical protein RvY_06681 [Ramazzottius varieornatus]